MGRLEEDSEGLIIVTNDGEFANRVLSHKSTVKQTWWVRVRGPLDYAALEKVRAGVWLSDGRTAPMRVKVLREGPHVSTLLALPTGQQHRLLRRVFAKAELSRTIPSMRFAIDRASAGCPAATSCCSWGSASRSNRTGVAARISFQRPFTSVRTGDHPARAG